MINIPPDVIEFHILKFLDYKDILKFTSCNKFLRTFKFLKINKIYSFEYYDNKIQISKNLKVHTIDLSWCEKITDVSALGSVHTLNLSGCHKIENVSALGNVHNLNLKCCYNIAFFLSSVDYRISHIEKLKIILTTQLPP